MTRAEREMMIGRYMSGGMSSAEEQEFFIQVAVDPELRIELKAHRTVESAFRKDRDAEPAGHTALRGRIAGMLAANPPQPAPVDAPSLPRPTIPDAPAVSVAAAGGFAIGKWFAGAALVATLTVGSILLLPHLDSDMNAAPRQPDTIRMAPPAVDRPQPDIPRSDSRQQESTPEQPVVTMESPTGTGSEPTVAPRTTTRPRPSVEAAHTNERPARSRETVSNDHAGSSPTPTKPARPTALPDLDGARPKRNGGDSIDIGAKIEVNK